MQKIVKQEREEKAKHVVVLYLLFPVMESSTAAVSDQESRAQTPTQDEDCAMKPLQALSLEVNN
jgi:hypothetical protein